MAIRVVCPHCDAAFNVAEELKGKKVRCRECEKPVPVVAAKPQKMDDQEEREERVQSKPRKPMPAPARRRGDEEVERPARRQAKRYDEDDEDDDDDRPALRKEKKKSSAAPLIIAAVGGGVVLIGGVIGLIWWLTSEKKPDNTVANAGQVKGPPGGMMGGGQGRMMGKDAPAENLPLGDPELQRIAQGVQHAKELSPDVRKRIEACTVNLLVKDKEKNPTLVASGSGFLAFEPGIVLTNAHVVDMKEPGAEEPESITVYLNKGTAEQKELKGKVLGVDQEADLAVVKVDPTGLPAPLNVKSSTGLKTTQPVYVCGFPFVRGMPVSNSITIFQGQVASLKRDEKTGVLKRVVLASEMQHGNSGGPVVDAEGTVVGVSVEGYEGTRINMALPGDYVHVIMNGRIPRLRIGQSSFSQGHVKVPVFAEVINPMGWLDKVEVDVWMGDDTPKYVPPASRNTPPAPRPGDSEHKRYELDLRGDKATGEFMLPDLVKGKAYYWQPILTYKNKDKDKPGLVQWSVGETYTPDDMPVSRRGAKLLHKKATGNRNVTVSVKEKFALLGEKGEEAPLTVQFDAELTEHPGSADAQGKSLLRLIVHSLKQPEVKIPDEIVKDKKAVEAIMRERHRALDGASHLDLRMLITERGDIETSVASANSAPNDIRAEVESLGDDILQWLQAVSVPLPNRQMGHNDPWTAKRPFAVLTPLGDLHFKAIDMNYTYLGIRNRNGREEALVDISGKLKNRESGLRFGCRLEGRALIDLETGLVTMARATTTMDLDLPLGRMRIPTRGTMEVLIERSLPQ